MISLARVSVCLMVCLSLATRAGDCALCRFGEAWAALGAEDFTHVRFSWLVRVCPVLG